MANGKGNAGVLMVEAIFNALRADENLGRGSCSSLDECITDDELKADIIEELAEGECYTNVKTALAWYSRLEDAFNERDGGIF